ncbi:Nucleoporin nup49/NSP49 (Nuclear pore protein nup49/NSP49) [Fusarium torreyae]|uniref:Nucleoporin nup49/NSP49 (Nuclear pore protein nup49/NSP49) n=1 Tax=Fusarium torreyae TaxID=1237075 RepID=A0A9W8RVL5_9HYPO|nr:Nucleoporin nup49/NSP49 (Nuclear pore protein nup49/NSP49) [Fusarium torreyae]
MSLTRSASGPAGGLSINTGAANAFGATASKPSAAGNLFGSATPTVNTTTAPGGTGTMSTAGGLFGGGAQNTGTGLFGQSATAGAATPSTGGLFGNAGATNTQQTQNTGTGLFGNAAAGNTQQQGQQQTGGGLFGQKPATGGGLFGNTAATQQSAPSTGTGLFGQSTQNQNQQQQQPQQPGGGLFGQSTATNTQPNTGTGLFGQSQAKPATGGGGLFGQAQPQQNNTLGQSTNQVSAVQINYDSIRPRTRFDDLAKPVQDEIALLDKGIQRVIKMRDEIGEFMPQHEKDIEQLGSDVKFVESKFRTVQVALNNDIQTVKALQDLTRKNAADARLCFRGADNLKLPTHYHQTGLFASQAPAADTNGADAASTHADAQDLITYFNRICDDIEKYKARLDDYRGDIERDMPGVENGLYEQIRSLRDRSAGSVVVQDQLNEVLLALRDTGSAIVAQAGQIADTRERLSRLQAGIVDSGVYAMGMNA